MLPKRQAKPTEEKQSAFWKFSNTYNHLLFFRFKNIKNIYLNIQYAKILKILTALNTVLQIYFNNKQVIVNSFCCHISQRKYKKTADELNFGDFFDLLFFELYFIVLLNLLCIFTIFHYFSQSMLLSELRHGF